MEILKKMRPLRIFNQSAYQALLTPQGVFTLILTALSVWIMLTMSEALGEFLSVGFVVVCAILIFVEVTMPYDFFEIKLKNQALMKVFVYEQRNKFFIEGQGEENWCLKVDDYIKKRDNYFLYKQDDDWFYVGQGHHDSQLLGKHIAKAIFSPSEHLLAVLSDSFVKYIEADNLYPEVTTCFLKEDPPVQIDDYFVVENKGKFTVYGMALNQGEKENSVSCFSVQAGVLAARNKTNAIALVGNANGEYELIGSRHDLIPANDKEISML